MDIQHLQKVREAQRLQRPSQPAKTGERSGPTTGGFRDILEVEQQRVAGNLKLSAHAQARMAQRDILMTPQDLEQLGQAVSKAESKGARESLVLMQNKGFIVSVPNRTVITALDQRQLQESIVTNIDSTIIV